jgi:outer membrane protein, heavy metal efflux system
MMNKQRLVGILILTASIHWISGCVTLPKERGITTTRDLVKLRSDVAGKAGWSDATSQDLRKPLTADDAVRVALARNSTIKLLYADLGISQAEVYDATRLSNPSLGYTRINGEGSATTTWSISQPITDLLFMHTRTRVAQSQLRQSQQHAAKAVLDLEAQVREQYYRYIAAVAIAKLQTQMAEAGAASALYAAKLHEAGNISALQLSREQAAASETAIERQRATTAMLAERSTLFDLLGLPVTTALQFTDELPAPLPIEFKPDALRTRALEYRLDLSIEREALQVQARMATHQNRWSWLGEASVGLERETEHPNGQQSETRIGPSASLELPLFNGGGGKKLRAQAEYEKAQSRVAALELSIANEISWRADAVRSASEIVDIYRNQLLPMRQRIVQLEQQRQTFMLIGLPELLFAKHEQRLTERSYIESLRDYWVSMAQLQRTLGSSPLDFTVNNESKVAP